MQCEQVADCRTALLSVLDAAVKLMDQADQRGSGQSSTCDTRVAFAHAVSPRHVPCLHVAREKEHPLALRQVPTSPAASADVPLLSIAVPAAVMTLWHPLFPLAVSFPACSSACMWTLCIAELPDGS